MNWDKLVVEQPPVKNLVITPFGFVCDVCGKSIAEGQRSLQRHMREHKISVTNEGYSNAVKAICSLQRSIRSDWSHVAKYLTGRKINGFSCHCVIGFGHRHVAKRHIDGGHCGATDLIEEELHEAVGGNAISLRAFKLHLFSDKKCSGLRFQRNRKSIPSDNPTCVEGTVNDTSETIAPYMRVDELTSVDVYYEMVYGYIAQFKKQATFQDSMVRSVHLWNLPVNKDDKEILVAEKLCSDWLTNHARMHVSRTPANIRASLLVFESATLLDTTQNSTFCFRLNTSIILREAQKMVRFLLRSESSSFEKELLKRECADKHPHWRVVPRCFLQMLLHPGTTYKENTPVVNYCVSRMYRLDGNNLLMSGAGKFANVCGDVLYLLRTAVCSCLYEDDIGGGFMQAQKTITDVRCSRTLNTLAPMIRRLRDIDNCKPKRYKSTVTTDGNVLVQAFVFNKDIIRHLIPIVTELCIGEFEHIFVGSTWRDVTKSDHPISVCQKDGGWFSFVTGEGSDGVSSSDLDIIHSTNFELHLATVMGFVDMMFHGFGGGPMRYQELQRMEMYNLVWHNNTFYYTCITRKKYNCLGTGSRITERKLPPISARIFLLHQLAISMGIRHGCQFSKPFGFDGLHMQDAVSTVFGLRDSPSCLDCHHLWASVSNVVSSSNHSVHYLSATEDASLLSGHSHGTHVDRYATGIEMGKEIFFQKYHTFLGYEIHKHELTNDMLPKLNSYDLESALAMIYGPNSNYMSNAQRDLVHAIACSNKHVTAMMHCGSGKSLGWILPILAARSFGRKFGSIIVVLPYRFLVLYHYNATEEILRFAPKITMATIFGTDVSEKEIPYFLDGTCPIPDLIFTTIDGMATLSRYHEGTIARLAGSGAIQRIIIDEVHTAFTELFRAPYEQLNGMAKYNIPLVLMSATMTDELASGMRLYMSITNDNCQSIRSSNFFGPLGDDFTLVIRISQSPTGTGIAVATKILQNYSQHGVHVIVATKGMAEMFMSTLQEHYVCALLSSSTPENEQKDISKRWKDGKIQLLVSTTCGLCGNENKSCRHVIVCGHLYSLVNIVQSIGRVRPSQRSHGSTFDLVFGEGDIQCPEEYDQCDEGQKSILMNKGLVKRSYAGAAMKILGKAGVVEWILNNSICRMLSLAKYFQQTIDPCMRCDIFRKTEEQKQHLQSSAGLSKKDDRWIENESLCTLKQLTIMCLVCQTTTCNGES